MDLEPTCGLAAHEVWSDDQVVENFFATTFDQHELLLLNTCLVSCFGVTLLIHSFELFDALLDLFGGPCESVVLSLSLGFHC